MKRQMTWIDIKIVNKNSDFANTGIVADVERAKGGTQILVAATRTTKDRQLAT